MNKLKVTPYGFMSWELLEDFEEQSRGLTIKVPKGFVTDGASVPRPLWVFLPPIGRYFVAAVIHDYLWETGMVSMKEADLIFYDLMIKYKTYKWKAKIMYIGVRIGAYYWKLRNKFRK